MCIARNVLLFTLLLDDEEGLNDTAIWNIYYPRSLMPIPRTPADSIEEAICPRGFDTELA